MLEVSTLAEFSLEEVWKGLCVIQISCLTLANLNSFRLDVEMV